jgi:hypothetical protein
MAGHLAGTPIRGNHRYIRSRAHTAAKIFGASGLFLISAGRASLDEVARYTAAADQARLARNALAKAVIR